MRRTVCTISIIVLTIGFGVFGVPGLLNAQDVTGEVTTIELPAKKLPAKEIPKEVSEYTNKFFRDYFYAPPELRQTRKVYDIDNFIVLRQPMDDFNSNFSLLTAFDGGVAVTEVLRSVRTVDQAKDYIADHFSTSSFEGVEVRTISLRREGDKSAQLFFVGNRGYSSKNVAEAAINGVRKIIEKEGGSFKEAVEAAKEKPVGLAAEQIIPIERPTPSYEAEEELAMKVINWFGAGDHIYGRFYAPPAGEQIVFQSFGETTFRTTNLESPGWNDQVGYYTNRLVFRGIRSGIGDTTFDPYVEFTPVLESNGIDFSSYLEVIAGVEWRPFHRNIAMQNDDLIDWIRNLRIFAAYANRYPLKYWYAGKKHDFEFGAEIYKEWGIDLPDIKESDPTDLWWGELYTKVAYNSTNFKSEDNISSWTANSNLKVGVKWPRIPIPENVVSDNVTFMPYMLFEHVNNSRHRNYFENRFFVGAGLRIMPFRNYRYSNNEWLFKTRLFVEWIGINRAYYTKDRPKPAHGRRHDLRFGVGISYRRY